MTSALGEVGALAPHGATEMSQAAVFETKLRSLPLLARGKVRDNYAVGADRLLMVATDRLSAFDIVLPQPVPGKGIILTQMALAWFARLADVVPNHLTGADPESVVAADERPLVRGRSMLVRRLEPLPCEAVVRGYLAGSGWKEYRQTGKVCGIGLPAGLLEAGALPEPIFTPATKAAAGDHDENISFDRLCALIGAARAEAVRTASLALYRRAAGHALARGIVIADTKFEFGIDEQGTLTLMDEVLTPDSSRFWPADQVVPGRTPPSYDKQPIRDWLQREYPGFGSAGLPPGLVLPQPVIDECVERYRRAQALLA
jgi:phosphoribosylaminoimidazole-succinocarboxamide synthase